MPGQHVVQRRRRAAVMHRRELDIGHALQQRDIDMPGGAEARAAIGDLARLLLCQRDQLGDVVGRQRWMREQSLVDANEAGDRCEVVDVVGQLAGVQGGVDDEHGFRGDHHAVAVGRGLADHRGADGVVGAAAILDDHLLAPCGREALRDQPRHGVAHPAGCGRHHDGDGPGRIGLRLRGICREQAAEQAERAKSDRHRGPPQSIFKLAALMTLAHLTESLCRYSAKASIEPGIGCTTSGSRKRL